MIHHDPRPGEQTGMTRWEHLVRASLNESELTALGADGWELVSAVYHAERMIIINYLKRPATGGAR